MSAMPMLRQLPLLDLGRFPDHTEPFSNLSYHQGPNEANDKER